MLKAIILSLITFISAGTMFVLFTYVSPASAADIAPQAPVSAPAPSTANDCASVAMALGYLTPNPALVTCSLD